MNPLKRILLIGVVAVGAAAGGFWFGHQSADRGLDVTTDASTTQPAEEDKPVAEVRVAHVRMESISQALIAYGSVTAQAGNVSSIAVPYESRVVKVLVSPGQQVTMKTNVIQIEPSPDVLATLQEAKQIVAVSERDFAQTQQRFNDHLATNAELSQAQQARDSSRLKLSNLTLRGIGAAQAIPSIADGVVSKVNVQPGQTVSAGASLIEIAADNQLEISLNVEPSDAPYLKPGLSVELTPVIDSASSPATGKIRTIVQRVDPSTRLASILVSMPDNMHWMLETFVQGRIVKSKANGLLVPREAVMPQKDGAWELFTVRDGHAVSHKVKLGLENDHDAQIISDEVKEGDNVIVVGNYELEDGMNVKIEGAIP